MSSTAGRSMRLLVKPTDALRIAVAALGWAMHGATTGAMAAVAFLLLLSTPPPSLRHLRHAATMLIGLAVGVVWERQRVLSVDDGAR